MAAMAGWPEVNELRNGYNVDAPTLNAPLKALADRTQWLLDNYRAIGDKSSVVIPEAVFDGEVWDGCVVAMDGTSGKFVPALATSSLLDEFSADESAYAVGIAYDVNSTGKSGRVCLYGKVDKEPRAEAGSAIGPGRCYLSSTSPGCVTTEASGPSILVGFVHVNPQSSDADYTLVNPQHMDVRSHVHRSYRLAARPAGDVVTESGAIGFADDASTRDAPLLVVSGMWMSREAGAYDVEIDFNNSWPCPVRWRSVSGPDSKSGTGSLRFFGDEVAIGQFGLTVSAVARNGSDAAVSFGTLRWRVRTPECRGWLQAGNSVAVNIVADDSDTGFVAVLRGVSEHGLDTVDVTIGENGAATLKIGKISWSDDGWADAESVDATLSAYDPVDLGNGLEFMVTGVPSLPAMTANFKMTLATPVPGAVYRYNVGLEPGMASSFPPVPAKSGSLVLNGVEVEEYSKYGDGALYGIGPDTLYWRSPDVVPWPETWASSVSVEDEMRMEFSFVSAFHSDTGPVTSLRPADGSPITVRRCGTGDDASVGDLELDLDLTMGVRDDNDSGYRAVKGFRSGKMTLGPVVERIVAGPGISLISRAGQPDGQGTVTISADGAVYSGEFETVALDNAKLESAGMFPYTRLLRWDPSSSSNVNTGFVAKFHVPATAQQGVYRVRFYATVFGEEAFNERSGRETAGVRLDWSILPDFTVLENSDGRIVDFSLKDSPIGPAEPAVLNIPFGVETRNGGYSYTAYDPMVVHNDGSIPDVSGRSAMVLDHAFPETKDELSESGRQYFDTSEVGVRPGDTVAIRFSRCTPTGGDAYVGAIGFLNLRWTLERVADDGEYNGEPVSAFIRTTVERLRRAAALSGEMNTSYQVVNVLQRLIDALK